MSLSGFSSSFASQAARRDAKYKEKLSEMAAPDSSCFIDDILRRNDAQQQAEDLTENTNMDLDSAALRKMKNRDAATRSRQKKKSESD